MAKRKKPIPIQNISQGTGPIFLSPDPFPKGLRGLAARIAKDYWQIGGFCLSGQVVHAFSPARPGSAKTLPFTRGLARARGPVALLNATGATIKSRRISNTISNLLKVGCAAGENKNGLLAETSRPFI